VDIQAMLELIFLFFKLEVVEVRLLGTPLDQRRVVDGTGAVL
jgi:hypothetical protein